MIRTKISQYQRQISTLIKKIDGQEELFKGVSNLISYLYRAIKPANKMVINEFVSKWNKKGRSSTPVNNNRKIFYGVYNRIVENVYLKYI